MAVFAHPDDETSAMAGTLCLEAARGTDVRVVTATRGELGALGAGGLVLTREQLPAVREAEERAVLKMYGVRRAPAFLGLLDQEVAQAHRGTLARRLAGIMTRAQPDVVFTFGPLGISRHPDHIALHHAVVQAFHACRHTTGRRPRLLYTAIPKDVAQRYELDLDGPEVEPNVFVDVARYWAMKVQGLRTYRSQEDALELAEELAKNPFGVESFHQAWPALPAGVTRRALWAR